MLWTADHVADEMGLTGEGGEGARLVASAAGPGNELRRSREEGEKGALLSRDEQ